MGTSTHSPERKKRGFEEKVLYSVDSSKKKLKFSDCIDRPKNGCGALKINLHANSHIPHVTPSMGEADVNRRTGFHSELHLLSHAALLCNGNLDLMMSSESKLTWFDQWLMFFKITWGKTMKRWVRHNR